MNPFELRNGSVRTLTVSQDYMKLVHDTYRSNPTIQACREVLYGVLFSGTISITSSSGQEMPIGDDFQEFLQRHWFSFGRDALDHLRMFGFVPYVLRVADDGVNYVPIVPPFGAYSVEMDTMADFRRSLAMKSQITVPTDVPDSDFYVHTWPNMEGVIVSPLMSLMPSLVRVETLTNAAIECDVAAARPTIVTQTQRSTAGAAPSTGTQNQRQVAVSTGVAEWFNETMNEMAGIRQQENDELLQQRVQNARAAAMYHNKLAVAAEQKSGQAQSDGSMRNSVLSLPAGVELARDVSSQTRQDLNSLHSNLVDSVCSVMGVPNSLIHPAHASYNTSGLVQRMVNAELVKQAALLSDVFSQVYTKMYGKGGSSYKTDGRKNRGVKRHAESAMKSGEIDAGVTVRVHFPPFVDGEMLMGVSESGVFKREYVAELFARSMGVWDSGRAKKNFASDADIRRDALARNPPTPAAKPAASPPPVVPARKKSKTDDK